MKKILFTVCAAIIVLHTYSAQSMINPWVDCNDDIACGAEKAGFGFPLSDGRKVIVRKAQVFEGVADENGIIDISGDYNEYPVNKTITLENGVKFRVRGDEDSYKVVNFAAETGYYSIMCDEGLKQADIEYFYELLEEAEAPQYSEEEPKTLEQLRAARLVDGIVEPIYTQDCFPRTLEKKGVTVDCFERANLGSTDFCSASEIKMIKEYYEKGQENDPLNDGNGNFCAEKDIRDN